MKMLKEDVGLGLLIAGGAVLVGMLVFWPSIAPAAECLKDQKTCKVLIVTPEQADSLKLLVQNTALTGPYNQIKEAVTFYTDMIDKAPAGTPAVSDPAKPAPIVEPKK